MIINPDNDGIDHINTYSKGKTELGKLLTNFAHTPFVHPKYGEFQSVEGFWYFKKTGSIYPELKKLHGYKAKQVGQKLSPWSDAQDDVGITEEFKEDILEAIRLKLRQNPYIVKMMIDCDLPFEHYYAYGNKIQKLPEYKWIIDELERIRQASKVWYQNKYK